MKSSLKKCMAGMLLITLGIISCKKDSTLEKEDAAVKTNQGFGSISYYAKVGRPGIRAASVSSDTIAGPDSLSLTVNVKWSFATVYVEKIAFRGKSNNLLDTTIIVGKKLDIFNANALAGVIKLPSGAYKDVNVKMFLRKSPKSDFAFEFKGTFTNSTGGTDSVVVGSSYPFEANLTVSDVAIDPSVAYNAVFSFDLNKVLTGITTKELETANSYIRPGNKKVYSIWKGGSQEVPYYDQVIQNWQNVAGVTFFRE